MSTHLWQQAAALAARAHQHQVRKDGRTPYASHTTRVTLTLACVFGCTDERVVAAALLHDTIEDCDVDYDELHEQFGPEVASIVACLTKDMRLIEPQREAAYDQQLAAGPWQAKLIKLADVYDNLSDCNDDAARNRFFDKVDRAVAIAGDQPELAKAVRIVRGLATTMRQAMLAGSRTM